MEPREAQLGYNWLEPPEPLIIRTTVGRCRGWEASKYRVPDHILETDSTGLAEGLASYTIFLSFPGIVRDSKLRNY